MSREMSVFAIVAGIVGWVWGGHEDVVEVQDVTVVVVRDFPRVARHFGGGWGCEEDGGGCDEREDEI